MKNKKSSIIGIFVAGAMLFGSVAIADVLIGDGYNGAKDALKYTTKTLSTDTDSFTVTFGTEIKCDGKTLQTSQTQTKYDFKNQKQEDSSEEMASGKKTDSYYYYVDSEKHISKNGDSEQYYQYNYPKGQSQVISLQDPFNEDIAADLEKVADAFVSNMKDFVQVKSTDEGGKLYYGNLDNTQIPSVANAISSVMLKYSLLQDFNREQYALPDIQDNLYFKNLNAKVSQNADGLLDNVLAQAIISGTDADGKQHELLVSCTYALTDVNSTAIQEPQIDADHLTVQDESSYSNTFEPKAIGTYKGDVVTLEGDVYMKKGERTVTITAVDENSVSGHITITGTADDMNTDFTATVLSENLMGNYCFEYTDKDGMQKKGILCKNDYNLAYGLNVSVYLNVSNIDEKNESWDQDESDNNNFEVTRCFD